VAMNTNGNFTFLIELSNRKNISKIFRNGGYVIEASSSSVRLEAERLD